jgi:hypothetical protein
VNLAGAELKDRAQRCDLDVARVDADDTEEQRRRLLPPGAALDEHPYKFLAAARPERVAILDALDDALEYCQRAVR